MYTPQPASSEITSIGDGIAIHAGSQRRINHGGIRESVRALTVVLPDGSLLRTGRATTEAGVGNDLTALFVGSQGTLGVIVEATVRRGPRPVRIRTAVASFDSLTAAADGVTAIIRSRVQPSVLDVANRGALAEIDRAQGTDLAVHGAALVLVQTAGYGADEEINVIAAALSTTTGRVTHPDAGDADRYSWLRGFGREPEVPMDDHPGRRGVTIRLGLDADGCRTFRATPWCGCGGCGPCRRRHSAPVMVHSQAPARREQHTTDPARGGRRSGRSDIHAGRRHQS